MMSMSNVWDRTAAFLGDNLRAVLGIALLAIFLPGAIDAVARLAATADGGQGAKLGAGVLSLALSLVALFGQLALVMLALDPARGAGGAFRAAGPRFPAVVGISALLLAAAFAAALPILLLMAVDGADLSPLERGQMPALSAGTNAMIALYVLIALPVAAWLATRLAVLTAVIAGERRGLSTLRRSFALTRGHAGRIFGTLLLILVVGGVAVMAVNLVVGSVLQLTIGRPTGFDPAVAVTAVAVAAASTALTVVLCAFVAKLYLALVARDGLRHEAAAA